MAAQDERRAATEPEPDYRTLPTRTPLEDTIATRDRRADDRIRPPRPRRLQHHLLPALPGPARGGLRKGQRVTATLRKLHDRFGTEATIQPSLKRAAAYLLGAGVLAVIALSV